MQWVSGTDERHYEVLGVTPDASVVEIRRAYLRAARDAHPDFHTENDASRLAAEERMRLVNRAWAVLGDVDERSAYDRRRLRPSAPPSARPTASGVTPEPDPFRPFDDGPDVPFDERDDRAITDSALPTWLAMLPVVLLGGGIVGLGLGSLLGYGALMALSVVSLVVAGVSALVAAPLVALGRAARGDRRR